MEQETYYLSSLESRLFGPPRKCVFLKRLAFRSGKECVVVALDPPVVGQHFGMGKDVTHFVLTHRHEGEGLSPILKFPCFVHITRPLIDGIESRDVIETSDVETLAWGELYRSERDAERHVFDD